MTLPFFCSCLALHAVFGRPKNAGRRAADRVSDVGPPERDRSRRRPHFRGGRLDDSVVRRAREPAALGPAYAIVLAGDAARAGDTVSG